MRFLPPGLRSRLIAAHMLLMLVFGLTSVGVIAGEQSIRGIFSDTVKHDGQLTQNLIQLQKLMDDQETGLRGFLLTRDRTFLQSYNHGRRDFGVDLHMVVHQAAAIGPASQVVRVLETRALVWQAWAGTLVRHPPSGSPSSAVRSETRGKLLFDRFRTASGRAVQRVRRHDLADLAHALRTISRTETLLKAAFIAGVVLSTILGWAILKGLTRPLRALHAAAERIGRGEMADPVVIRGAQEFDALGGSLDDMRKRLSIQYDELQGLNAALSRREAQYRLLADNSTDMISRHSPDGVYLYASPACRNLLGYESKELVGRSAYDFFHPEDVPSITSAHSAVLDQSDSHTIAYRIRHKRGHYIWLETTARTVKDPETGAVVEIQSASRDISERVRLESERVELVALQRASCAEIKATRVLDGVLRSTPVAIATVDPQGTLLSWNPEAERLFGWTEHEVVGHRIPSLLGKEDQVERDIARVMQGHLVREAELQRLAKDGRLLHLSMSVSPLLDIRGETIGATIALADITERKLVEESLHHQATHDALTDLPNRVLLHDRIEHGIQLARRGAETFALLLLDLNRFKEINDTFGHHLGDQLLKQLALRLRGLLRDSDTVARLGGDEFAVILPEVNEQGAVVAAQKILAAIARPFLLESQRFVVGASIGVCVYPDHGDDVDTLLRHADVAMYAAKTTCSEIQVYDRQSDHYDPLKVTILGEFAHALERNELELFYQPKVELATGQVRYVEALLRWNHKDRGFVPPDEFIPLVERTDLIRPLTMWVLKTALRQCRAWHDAHLKLHVAVNLSAWNLHDAELPEAIARVLSDCSAAPGWLKLEVTETAVMTNPEQAMAVLVRLSAMGISISIDDFGTGYSSLAYLKRLPVDEIKIDRSFVTDMSSNEEDATIVRSVVDLGHSLKLEVVAEGVEDKQTLELLRDRGCDHVQGYYLSRPIPARDLMTWLTQWEERQEPTLEDTAA